MQQKKVLAETRTKMTKAVDFVLHEFSTLHTGKATPAMVEHVRVEAYGSMQALKECAAITTPDPRTIQITPWDKGLAKPIEKAIIDANLGLNPRVDGALIRISVPELTGERRKALAKQAAGMAEEGKVRVRSARREGLEALKKLEKDKAISEDELKRAEKEVQVDHDKLIAEISTHLTKKEKELTTV